MLIPNKHTNLKKSIINISGNIIEILKENWNITYSELFWILWLKIGKEIKEPFLYSLSFLYSLWKIEYIRELDSFKLK